MMKSYMRSHLRDSLKTLLYLVVFSVAVTLIFSGSNQCYPIGKYIDGEYVLTGYYYSSELGIPVWILAISCFVLPVLEFSFFKKRRNLDCAYALPISRREMGIVHYVTGLLLLVIPYSCSYLINFLLMLRYPGAFELAPLLGHYFIILALGICFYALYVFVFNEANSTGDGIWFIILWTVVFYLISSLISTVLIDNLGYQRYEDLFVLSNRLGFLEVSFPLAFVSTITRACEQIVEKDETISLIQWLINSGSLSAIVFWALLGTASGIGFFFSFGKRAAQKTEEVSDSWFGYRLMIPIYAVCGMILALDIGACLIVEVIAVVGYMIYRKGLHLKKSDWISLAVFPVIAFIVLVAVGNVVYIY